MDKEKINALLEALRKLLEADLVDLESLRIAFKPPKSPKQGTPESNQDDPEA